MAAGMPRQRLIESWYPDGELLTATPGRRLGGELLDAAIQFVCVFGGGLAAAAFPPALLLIFAWPVWFAFVARWGQTPGKQLLGMYVMRDDGSRAGGWYTVLRDFVIQGVLFGAIIGGITFGIGWAIAGVWCVWDRERRCLWDRIASTTVAWSPREFRPLTAADLERLGQRPPAFASRRDAPSPPPPALHPTCPNDRKFAVSGESRSQPLPMRCCEHRAAIETEGSSRKRSILGAGRIDVFTETLPKVLDSVDSLIVQAVSEEVSSGDTQVGVRTLRKILKSFTQITSVRIMIRQHEHQDWRFIAEAFQILITTSHAASTSSA